MSTYLVERYIPGLRRSELLAALVRVEAEAARMQAEGITVQYLGSTYAIDDETCLCTFVAESAAAVREASARAGVPLARVVAAERVDPTAPERCASTATSSPEPGVSRTFTAGSNRIGEGT
jgi:hypothetical protein